MKIPNFDDKDLAIVGVIILGMVIAIISFYKMSESAGLTALFAFEGTVVTGVVALATGRKKEPEEKKPEPEKKEPDQPPQA